MRIRIVLPVLALTLLSPTGAAYAASASSPGDPPAGSPAGAVYQLPFEEGRADAAPKGSGGTAAPGEGGRSGGDAGPGSRNQSSGAPSGSSDATSEPSGAPTSMYRSENNFGSSSQVPGATAGGPGGGDRGDSTGSGQGVGTAGGDGAEQSFGLTPGELTDSGNTSTAANVALMLLILVVAGGVGVVSLLARRTSTPG